MIEITVPGDKSITHRSLMLASLASGRSLIRLPLDSADTQSTAAVLRALGVAVPDVAPEVVINGGGLRSWSAPTVTLDCGNSGTTTRLMMGLVAGCNFAARFDGDDSLRSRPMRRVSDPLKSMGAKVRELGKADRLPIEIKGGHLHSIELLNNKSSAQVKSAILFAALMGSVPAVVIEPVHSRDHTERMLSAMGVTIRTVVTPDGMRIEIDPASELAPLDMTVPGDFSSAAFFLARGLLGKQPVRIRNVGVNATRTGLLDVLRRMHAHVHVEDRIESGGEPVATLNAKPSELHGVEIAPAEIPHLIDEVPILAVLAARANGETVIRGAGELRVKETDRLSAVAQNLNRIGADVEETADGLVIEGSDAPLRGSVKTFGDHRIAMAFGVLGSLPGNSITIDDPACVAVSFPTFWEQLRDFTE